MYITKEDLWGGALSLGLGYVSILSVMALQIANGIPTAHTFWDAHLRFWLTVLGA